MLSFLSLLYTTNFLLQFFFIKNILRVDTFQDASSLENDSLILALLEIAVMFSFIEELDFVVSLDTSVLHLKNNSLFMSSPYNI